MQNLQEIYSLILGGISTASWHDVGLALPYVVVAVIVVLAHRACSTCSPSATTEAARLGINGGARA